MCDRNKIPLIFFVVAGIALIARLSLGQDAKEIWGKRIWERKVDEQRRIVVDERGVANTDPKLDRTIRAPKYYWRLLENGKEDGPVLYTCLGYNSASGVGPALEPVEVLWTDLVDGDLLTIFNQHEAFTKRDRCWAMVVHSNLFGSFVERPQRYGQSPTGPGLVDNSLGEGMKTAKSEKEADGTLLLTVTDKDDQIHKFELRLRIGVSPPEYCWQPVEDK